VDAFNTTLPASPTYSPSPHSFLLSVLERHWDSGVPLWPFVASSLHAAFLAGETGEAHVVVITWDPSVHGWGAVVRWWDNKGGKVIVGPLPDTPDMLHQVRREALGGVLCFEAASRVVSLEGATVIMRNDASGALAAFPKGSFSTTFLQKCSMRLARAAAVPSASMLYLHAPGRVLIDEGVDDLSRDTALDIAGPVTNCSGPSSYGSRAPSARTGRSQ
jgi:hypothetical protein